MQPFDLWGQRGYPHLDIVGESNYVKQIAAALKGIGARPDPSGDIEVVAPVQLVPEPDNRYDRNAVRVLHGHHILGYLPREDAARYAPPLSALHAAGHLPQANARIWAGQSTDWETGRSRFTASVRLDLGEPHLLAPQNPQPTVPHALLPEGRKIQVSGEEKHMDSLVTHIGPVGENWIYVTLHEIVEQKARSAKTLLEVRVDGVAAGSLSSAMSTDLLPVVRHLHERGLTAAAKAVLKGNRLKADIAVAVCRGSEVPDTWLAHLPTGSADHHASPATDVVPMNTKASTDVPVIAGHPTPPTPVWQFNAPPGWPPPPPGWLPPQGWQKPPAWPEPPAGWQFWLPVQS